MPFVNVLPEAKVYDRKYSPQSMSDDHREAIRISHVGVKFSVYHCRRISEGKKKAFLGRRLQRF
jgi:hypothetical protein